MENELKKHIQGIFKKKREKMGLKNERVALAVLLTINAILAIFPAIDSSYPYFIDAKKFILVFIVLTTFSHPIKSFMFGKKFLAFTDFAKDVPKSDRLLGVSWCAMMYIIAYILALVHPD
ncbi:hypothetical protein ACFBZI_04770 [Moraxella sp. ZJ142]|uniref:hypothetical protein n=1 Tax=Moraxella marmotae TaxID=3344520 RepID=UPI0035D4C391